MNLNEYQLRAAATLLPSANNLNYLVSGLAAEAGEVAGVYAKHIRDDREWSVTRDKMSAELGDLLWFVSQTASKFDLNLNDIAQANLDKLRSRQVRDMIMGDGDNR